MGALDRSGNGPRVHDVSDTSPPLRSIAVYCGSNVGEDPSFASSAARLGHTLAERGIRLVYGGGHVGLMGVLADAALESGGSVTGVITRALADKEVAHSGLTRLEVVTTMHERKAMMADEADAFIMMPGGFGTLDEFFEVVTWTQLGIHDKACGVMNVSGYFDPLLAWINGAVELRFVRAEHLAMMVVDDDPVQLIDEMAKRRPIDVDKWLERFDR